jgi:hypothetical protein
MLVVASGVVAAGQVSAASTSTWKLQSIPSGYENSYLLGLSCPSKSDCAAVGWDISGDSSGSAVPFAERWSGGSWAIQSVANPIEETTELEGVSCPNTSLCTAVGFYYGSSGQVPLAEVWSGGTSWTAESASIPSGATSSQLTGVSCPKATSVCSAVGLSANGSGVQMPLAEWWNGSGWTIQSVPIPSGSVSAQLSGVSCSSSSDCTAVGTFVNGSSVQLPLAERWNGSSWTVQTTPTAAGAASTTLNAVACPSADAYTAVGSYNESGVVSLAERWNGTTWTVQSTPNPVTKSDRLFAVSCPSASICTAAGSYENASGVLVTLAERWSGGSWAVQSTPNPSGLIASINSGQPFDAVSCASSAACIAVGSDSNTGHFWTQVLAERYS